jgi:hypothetical protein
MKKLPLVEIPKYLTTLGIGAFRQHRMVPQAQYQDVLKFHVTPRLPEMRKREVPWQVPPHRRTIFPLSGKAETSHARAAISAGARLQHLPV